VVRHSGGALLRGVEQAESGVTGAQAKNFDAGNRLLCRQFRTQRLLVKPGRLIQVLGVKIPRAHA